METTDRRLTIRKTDEGFEIVPHTDEASRFLDDLFDIDDIFRIEKWRDPITDEWRAVAMKDVGDDT